MVQSEFFSSFWCRICLPRCALQVFGVNICWKFNFKYFRVHSMRCRLVSTSWTATIACSLLLAAFSYALLCLALAGWRSHPQLPSETAAQAPKFHVFANCSGILQGSTCVACGAHSAPNTHQTECVCDPGYAGVPSNTTGLVTCTQCTGNSFSNAVIGTRTCAQCSADASANAGFTACVCNGGFSGNADSTGQATCTGK